MIRSMRMTCVVLIAAAAAASTALAAVAATGKPEAGTESITLRDRPMAGAAHDEATAAEHVATVEDNVGFNLEEQLVPATTCPPAGNATFTWTVTDGCFNDGLFVRFFDETNNLVWPNSSQVYVIANGRSSVFRLSVKRGAKICYGADSGNGNFYWGVSAEGNQACPDCCNVVPNTGNLARSVRLVCR
jgi:hypothetical protein